MSKFGKEIIRSLKQFIRDVDAGKPMKQTVRRRMQVKDKTVYARETFTSPVREEKP